MTAQVHDHIHLDTGTRPATTYPVAQGSLDHAQEVSVAYERGITGMLHVHRLEDGVTAGKPIQFEADKETIIIRGTSAITELNTLRALSGRQVYYAPNYHDDDEDDGGPILGRLRAWPDSAYVIRGILVIQPGAVMNLDPMMEFWTVQIQIIDDSEVTS